MNVLERQWSRSDNSDNSEDTIASRFERQVAAVPDKLAIVTDESSLTYRALDLEASRIAAALASLPSQRDRPIALFMKNEAARIAAMLGALKANRILVPLAPNSPEKWVTQVIEDSGTAQIIVDTSTRSIAELAAAAGSVNIMEVDQLARSSEPLVADRTGSPDDTAYIFYTSGSTGRPKGVANSHRSLTRRGDVRYPLFGLGRSDRYANLRSSGVSSGINNSLLPLLSGGCLFPFDLHRHGLQELASWLIAQKITYVNFSGSLLRTWLALLPDDLRFPALRFVGAGGERLYAQDVIRLTRHLEGDWRVGHSYSSTECGTIAAQVFTPSSLPSAGFVAVGRPVDGVEVCIADATGAPVQPGEIGEIVVRSRFLAQGYWKNPDLTAKVFQADPLDSTIRIYRTGDLGCWRSDGTLELAGRKGRRIRLRGYNVEPFQVECELMRQPGVTDALVLLHDDAAGQEPCLVGYVVAPPNTSSSALRKGLAEWLPSYMVPSHIVVLDSFPIASSGKIDRKALPSPEGRSPELEGSYVAPRTPTEEVLASIWREVLKLERVGVHDNFFELGGHSLHATQVVARLAKLLKLDLPLRRFFETATISALAAELQKMLGAGGTADTRSIVPVPHTGNLPLSFAQQRLWLIDRLLPNKAAYNMPTVWQLRGQLDALALERSLNELVARHEALRTRFALSGDAPVQMIEPLSAVALPITDLSAMPQAEREARVRQITDTEARQPFDLEAGPLLRAQLLRLAAGEHLLLLNVHHIACDGWSKGVLWRELSSGYTAFVSGHAPDLPRLPIQYADYAVWQREWLQGEALERQLAYWKEKLANLSTLELPTDRLRPPVPSHQGAHHAFDLPAPLTQALKELSRREGATLFMTLLAAFQVLLHRSSAQDDIAVGTPIAGRGRTELEGLIGFFVNTLVLRSDLTGNPAFTELLARVRETTLGAYTHQDLPFDKLVEEISPSRDMSRNPLFDVMFVLQNAPDTALALKGVQASRLPLAGHSAKFDLTLAVSETAAGLHASWEYSADLFDASTVERMALHFKTLLEGIVADADQCIGQLPLLTDAERHQLQVEWNQTAVEYPRDSSVHQLFEAQVERTPDAVAVVFEDQRLTYRELNIRSNQIAHHLRTLGVGPEVLVGLCLERSLSMIAGLLGILKAGGAYVPLDPAYPKDRLAFMLADANLPLVVTQNRADAELPAHNMKVLNLEQDWAIISQQPQNNLSSTVSAENLAYVLYTSGSTGKPKGVAMNHGPLQNLIVWQGENAVSPNAKTLQFASLNFDVSFQEIFSTLCWGGTLVVVSQEIRQDISALLKYLTDQLVERLFLPFVALQQLAETAASRGLVPSTLREIITAGEQLQISPQILWLFERLEHCILHNQYGPTESHVVTACTLSGSPHNWPTLPPIGRPIAKAQIYLLDRYLNCVPIGVAGELYIGGDVLARGYQNRADLTKERFITNPFGHALEARLYKTGDYARYLPDGNIEYLGRKDDQMKVRGYRIELGEIEATLLLNPAVSQAAVALHGESNADRRLVAYLVSADGAKVDLHDLRMILNSKLPNYMIPSAFVMLDAFPLTPNGKLDRKALPAPEGRSPELEGSYVAPRTPTEEVLASIWREVLKLERVGVHDNFFELGGHSLLVVRLLSHIQRTLKIEVPFAAPTIAGLAEYIQATTSIAASTSLVPLRASGTGLPLFLVSGRSWLATYYRHLLSDLKSDRPVFGLQPPPLDGKHCIARTIESMAADYISEIRRVQPHGPYFLAGHSFGGQVIFEMAHQLVRAGERVSFLGLIDTGFRVPPVEGRPLLSEAVHLSRRVRRVHGFQDLLSQGLRFMRNTVLDLWIRQGRSVPYEHRAAYYEWLCTRASLNYVPKPYPGHITMFGSAGSSERQRARWAPLAGGGLTVLEVPAGHVDMVLPPHSKVLAEHFDACLNKQRFENETLRRGE